MRVAVCRLGREFQLLVRLVQQILGLLSVAIHVPLIGLLRVQNLLPGLVAQSLRGSQIRVAAGRNVLRRFLRDGARSDQEQSAENGSDDSKFNHGGYSTRRRQLNATR